MGTSCGYSVPFFDYAGERLVLDEFFTKLQDGSEIRPDGVPKKLVEYWNKKNSLSIDSMGGLKIADDLSTALTPPFKLEEGRTYVKVNEERLSDHERTDIHMSRAWLNIMLACIFMLGFLTATGLQTANLLNVKIFG